MSGVESVTAPSSHDALPLLQASDDELRTLLASIIALRLERQHISGTTVSYCDTSGGELSRTFQLPYGSKWSNSSRICRTQAPKQQQGWSHSVSCGQTYRRVVPVGFGLARPASAPKSPATQLLEWDTSRCWQPLHVDLVGPLPTSAGYVYCLPAVDVYTRWPEAIPIPDITDDIVSRTLLIDWISRYGCPLTDHQVGSSV
jgi:hypothetical protein